MVDDDLNKKALFLCTNVDYETISIIYGKSDSMIMLQNLKAALAYQQLKEALENTDGL